MRRRAASWILMFSASAFGQISPGALSHAHRHLDKISRCAACHDFGAGTRGFKCLDCHVEIQHRIAAGAGYHARVYKASAGQKDCTRCHTEHTGEKIPPIRFDRAKFDHRAETGYALEGAHIRRRCEECHNPKNIQPATRAEIKMKDLSRSFLGLPHDCATCHQDPHTGELGTNCTGCHNQSAWRPAAGFSHATAFPLTGAHTNVACEKCHSAPAGQKPVHFKGAPAGSCRGCHMDPHKGAFQDAKFSGACESCHTTAGWKTNHPSAHFNHDTTPFALRGKHADLSCARCHRDADFHRAIAHDRCSSCHEDKHQGQFAGKDCAACHNETGFKPALFTRDSHQLAAFHLDGKHREVACEKCHPDAGGHTQFKTAKLRCAECHTDPHDRQFAAAPYSNQCEKCHTTDGFKQTTFTIARHAETKFALTGAHAKAACDSCHTTSPAGRIAARNYRFATRTCDTCHKDPHDSKLVCEGCHRDTAQWKSVASFDHAATKFPIQGAHQKVACDRCHARSGTATSLKFAGTATQCSGCHNDIHGGQFTTAPARDCSGCHTMERWNAADFTHDKTRFPLDVAHRNVRCERCHKQQLEVNAKTIRVFRGTPTECVSCH
ncbi:MAG: hypothetical protein LAO79_09445 [Acidobacteriia bacterium]|nr:hypothetical protein [Terriglobia bacterium]